MSDKSNKKVRINPISLLLVPIISFFILYFLFPSLSKRFLKICVSNYDERVVEIRNIVKSNNEKANDSYIIDDVDDKQEFEIKSGKIKEDTEVNATEYDIEDYRKPSLIDVNKNNGILNKFY